MCIRDRFTEHAPHRWQAHQRQSGVRFARCGSRHCGLRPPRDGPSARELQWFCAGSGLGTGASALQMPSHAERGEPRARA
eukprot:11891469-Alexandrium_andersonii.AAC.1